MGTKFNVVIGQFFGDWCIIDDTPIRNQKGYYFYKCKCICGTERLVVNSNLKRGISTNCGCKIKGKPAHNFQGIGDLSQKYFRRLEKGALNRNIKFEIDKEYSYSLFKGKCNISGLDITLNRDVSKQTASLDRIDSSKGYIPGNIQWVHKDVNLMKNKFSQDYFLKICNLIAQKNK